MPTHKYSAERKQLCRLLVEAREIAGLTQNDVAKTGIVSQTEISKIENGARKVEFIILVKLAELYKRDIKFFVTGRKPTTYEVSEADVPFSKAAEADVKYERKKKAK